MTKQVKYNLRCEKCSSDLVCTNPNCENYNKPSKSGTNFSKWLRGLPGPLSSKYFNNQNLDHIWFNYRNHWFITIEEKIQNGKSTLAQRTNHSSVSQMLWFASKISQAVDYKFDVSYGEIKKFAVILYKGHYVVRFSQTDPDDSEQIEINGQGHTKIDLLILLMSGELVNTETIIDALGISIKWPLPVILQKLNELEIFVEPYLIELIQKSIEIDDR